MLDVLSSEGSSHKLLARMLRLIVEDKHPGNPLALGLDKQDFVAESIALPSASANEAASSKVPKLPLVTAICSEKVEANSLKGFNKNLIPFIWGKFWSIKGSCGLSAASISVIFFLGSPSSPT